MNTPSDPSPAVRAQSLAQQYHAEGFLILREVFDHAEMAAMDAEATRVFQRQDLIDQDNIRCRWQNCARTGGAAGEGSCRMMVSSLRSAGFQTCCKADFQIGTTALRPAGLETRATPDLEVCATMASTVRRPTNKKDNTMVNLAE
jgi:hypothetical protein